MDANDRFFMLFGKAVYCGLLAWSTYVLVKQLVEAERPVPIALPYTPHDPNCQREGCYLRSVEKPATVASE